MVGGYRHFYTIQLHWRRTLVLNNFIELLPKRFSKYGNKIILN